MGASVLNQTAPSDSEIEEAVYELVERMAPDKGVAVTAETTLIDELGYDSAQIVELGLTLERRLGCELKQTQLGATTVAELVGIVRAACRSGQAWDANRVAPLDVLRADQAALEAAGVPSTAAQPGNSIGDFDLLDIHGDATTLSTALGGRPAVVVLYRGAWCPHCNTMLGTYQRDLVEQLDVRGIALIAISPQKPDGSQRIMDNNDLSFTLLSDPSNQVALSLGVQISPAIEVQTALQSMGIQLSAVNIDGTEHLPMPTVVLVDSGGVIRWVDVRPNYATRTTADDILAALTRLP